MPCFLLLAVVYLWTVLLMMTTGNGGVDGDSGGTVSDDDF